MRVPTNLENSHILMPSKDSQQHQQQQQQQQHHHHHQMQQQQLPQQHHDHGNQRMQQHTDPMISSFNEQTGVPSEIFHLDQSIYSVQTIPNELITTMPSNIQSSDSMFNLNSDLNVNK